MGSNIWISKVCKVMNVYYLKALIICIYKYILKKSIVLAFLLLDRTIKDKKRIKMENGCSCAFAFPALSNKSPTSDSYQLNRMQIIYLIYKLSAFLLVAVF